MLLRAVLPGRLLDSTIIMKKLRQREFDREAREERLLQRIAFSPSGLSSVVDSGTAI
jgi:hypothetical protein